ncbi:GHKL domain-containing protein [Chitinophaga oryzae]|uniref:histidine kinase n=1 Tax=Chitinophaga oryzae TaxID=2725414 RepID=A0AAE7D9I4_9BACT|nr:7TM diverse intracellular signaling domain-containing protein [Chitinophaga oryzae]QJB33900.1 GHKL domain-containing protein [Chitinophaga oryzae]QJB40430.1 GHKL domain-containing protein [Chitinophaga oryzae]
MRLLIRPAFYRFVCLLLLVTVRWIPAWADTINISPNYPIQLAEYGQLEYLLDPAGHLTFAEVEHSPGFQKLQKQIPNFGLTKDAIWLRFTVKNNTQQPELMFNITYPILDLIDLYYPGPDNRYEVIPGGELRPFKKRPVVHQNFVYNISIPNGTAQTFYVRIQSRETILVPIYIGTSREIYSKLYNDDLLLSIYIGIILVMIFYNIFIFSSVRDWSYFYYIIYIACVGLTQLCLHGFGYRFFWHENLYITEQSVLWAGALSGISVLVFVQSFLHVREKAPWAYRIMNLFVIVYSSTIVLSLLGYFSIAYALIDFLAITGVSFILLFAIMQAVKHSRTAKIFVLAWTVFILAIICFVLKDVGIIPYNIFTSHIIVIGSAIEVILLSFALADKINTFKAEKEASQAIALEISKENEQLVREQNIILEAKVQERTEELQNSNRDLNVALTNLKDTQTRLVEKEKMASLGQLTAGIAHEINNPINFVTSNIKPLKLDIADLQALLNRYDGLAGKADIPGELKSIEQFKREIDIDYIHEEISSLIKGIEDGAARTAEIVKGLRTFSRLDESDVKSIDIHEGLDSTLVLLRNAIPPNVNIIKDYAELPKVECYAGKINQVFMNIFSNALNAIKSKKEQHDESITITTRQEGQTVIIRIRDTGIGMSEEVQQKIFDPFFTTKDVGEGTGLGLSIVFSIIEKHKGKIIVNSTPGQGAEFIIYLPLNITNHQS